MTSIKCKNCGKDISNEAAFCPGCGHPNKKGDCLSVNQYLLLSLVIIGVLLAVVVGLEAHFENKRINVHEQLAIDAVEQYNIIKSTGNHAKICLHARIVAASYLKANNEVNYQKWKALGNEECKR